MLCIGYRQANERRCTPEGAREAAIGLQPGHSRSERTHSFPLLIVPKPQVCRMPMFTYGGYFYGGPKPQGLKQHYDYSYDISSDFFGNHIFRWELRFVCLMQHESSLGETFLRLLIELALVAISTGCRGLVMRHNGRTDNV